MIPPLVGTGGKEIFSKKKKKFWVDLKYLLKMRYCEFTF